jgi:GDP-6-deoxy-D-talose 4-dehydrogenase
MKTALVTGIDGFTGRYVAADLAAHGWEVWGIGLRQTQGQNRYFRCDLADVPRLTEVVADIRPDAVIHLAGIAFVAHGDAQECYRTNLLGSRNLLAALAAFHCKPASVVMASSANVYGNVAEGWLDEQSPTRPANDYAVSKLAMEYMARLWLDVLPIVIVRPFNYTGVGQAEHFLLPKIVAHFRRRDAVIKLGNLDVWRDFSDVRAVARVYRCLLEPRFAGETVNVASGRMHSLREILDMARAITGHDIRVEIDAALVRSTEVRRLGGSPARLRDLIGGWDTPPLEETLRWMLSQPG